MTVEVYFDGSCDNNSKLKLMAAGAAFIVDGKHDPKYDVSKVTGSGNSFLAEWMAMLEAFKATIRFVRKNPEVKLIRFYSDSEVLVRQYCGKYRIRHKQVEDMWIEAKKMESEIVSIFIDVSWVSRNKNFIADSLADKAIKSYFD